MWGRCKMRNQIGIYLAGICIILIAVTGCFSEDSEFNLGEEFEFSAMPDNSMINSDAKLSISDLSIEGDSRCRPNVVCVWEGNAEVALTFQKESKKKTITLNTSPNIGPSQVTVLGYTIALIRLNFPEKDAPYVVTLLVSEEDDACNGSDCEPVVCQTNKNCETTEYCHREPATCSSAAGGVCAKKPEICTMIYDPVCGCDNETYASECSAASAGVSIDYKGECCTMAECGPVPAMPTHPCDDGTIAGPEPCRRNEDGMCGYKIVTCP